MTTQCMQNQLATRSDGVIATGLRRSRLISSLTALYLAAAERAARARARRSALRQLSTLSDRQLADIGIERSRIQQVVDGLMGAAERRAHGGAR
ncbi:MAG: DUF1127 domain-containing protein [Gammaproteobacteria bacterium]|nr:DUF1127 domain-containing protein [Gammaproteobacteria bacterium]